MKGSLIIIAFFVLGIVCGHQHLLPDSLNVADLSFYALCALMFFVGISVGCDPKTLLSFRQLNRGRTRRPRNASCAPQPKPPTN